MASQRQCRHERSSLRLKRTAKLFLQAPGAFVMVGGGKLIGKALLLVGFTSYLDSRNYQTQAVHLGEKIGLLFISLHGGSTSRSQTD